MFALLAITVPASAAVTAPLKEWTQYYGGDDGAYGMAATSDGYALIGGLVYGGNGSGDMYLARTDLNGNKLWTKSYGGAKWDIGYGVAATGDGFICTGVSQSFDSAGNEDLFLVKTDANGNVVWQKTFGGPQEEFGYAVAVVKDGYVITGKAETPSGDDYIYLLKVDKNGNLVWQQKIPGIKDIWGGIGDCEGRCVIPASDGYVVIGNTFASNMFLLKTDLDGNTLWLQDLGIDAESRSVCAASDGYVFAAQGNYLTGGNGSQDILLAKTDLDGNVQWKKVFGGKGYDFAYSVLPVDGGYVVAGGLENTTTGYDTYLFKADLNGNMIWDETFGGTNSETGYAVAKAPDGGYVIGGDSYYGLTLWKTYPEGSTGATPTPLPARELSSGKAPVEVWNKTFGGAGYDNIQGIVAVSDGYVCAGTTSANTGRQQLTIFKTDRNGKMLWQSNYTSCPFYDTGISIAPAGDGYVALEQYKQDVEDAGASLVRYDRDGIMLWNKSYKSDVGFDHMSRVIAVSGGFLAVGTTESWDWGNNFEKYILLIKTDLNGNQQWLKTIKASYPQGGHDVVAVSDGYVITGDTGKSSAYFTDELGQTHLAPWHEMDVSLVKVDLNGNLVWQKYFSSPYAEYGDSIATVGDGFVIAGSMSDNDGKNGSIFLMRTDASGKQLWLKTYGLRDLTTPGDMFAESNGYVVAGETKGSNGINDVYLMKADLDGNLLWQTAFDTPGADTINAVIADGGRYVLAGNYDPYDYTLSDNSAYSYLLAVAPDGSSSTSAASGSGSCCCCGIFPWLILVLLVLVMAAGYLYWKNGGKIDGLQGQAEAMLNKIKQAKK